MLTRLVWYAGISFLAMTSTSFAGKNCPLESATYSSGSALLEFDKDISHKIVLTVGSVRLEGYVIEVNGYGYTAYQLSEAGKTGDDAAVDLSDTVYTLSLTKNGNVIGDGGWLTDPAPPAILLSNAGRNLYNYLKERGREAEFTQFDDVFSFSKCPQ